jgi:glycosyltransferase involved in cell wall biosynthesis
VNDKKYALNVLTRNAAPWVIRAIESIRCPLDEIVIIDTGSTDESPEILAKYLAREQKSFKIIKLSAKENPELFVVDVAENFPGLKLGQADYTGQTILGDFGAARQKGLDATESTYMFWLDSDDMVRPGDSLSPAFDHLAKHDMDLGIAPYIHRRGAAGSMMARASFARVGAVRWFCPIHETLELIDSSHKTKSERVALFDTPTILDLFDRTDDLGRVPFRNLKLLHRALFGPNPPSSKEKAHLLFHLALESREINDGQKSLEYFEQFINEADEKISLSSIAAAHIECGKIYEISGQKPLLALGEYTKAHLACPDLPEAYFGLGRISYTLERYQRAVVYIQKGLDLCKTKNIDLFFHDPAERDGKSRIFLALALSRTGHYEEARKVCEEGTAFMPKEFKTVLAIVEKRALADTPAKSPSESSL